VLFKEGLMAEKRKLGEMLVDAGLIDEVQLQSALGYQSQWGMRLGAALIDMKFITEDNLVAFLEDQLNTKCITIMDRDIPPEALKAVNADLAKDFSVFPIKANDKGILLATADPLDLPTLDQLSFKLRKRVVPCLALEAEIKRAILFHYDGVKAEDTPIMAPNMHNVRVLDQMEIIHEDREKQTPKPAKTDKKEVTTQHLVEAMMRALEKKGIITRADVYEELE